jgi:hypothetical protein
MKFIIHNSKFIIAAAALLLLVSCHKNCVCLGYDGGSYTYTADEVDARNVTCADMIYLEGTLYRYYSICEWE